MTPTSEPAVLAHPLGSLPGIALLPRAFLDKTEWVGECLVWTASQHINGYGQYRNKRYGFGGRAHRFAYQFVYGPIPEGLQLDHLCRNRLCVNPHHLEAVTAAENTRRAIYPNSLKTHCPKGHPYDEANTRITGRGSRICKTCHREAELARYWADPEPRREAVRRRSAALRQKQLQALLNERAS